MNKALEITVGGRVQRVGYRMFVQDTAQEAGLSGTVKNQKDGTVAIFIQGDEERISSFLDMIKNPPEPAKVTTFETKDAELNPRIKGFTIVASKLADELQEGFGAS
ncbi:MAG: acylphosphatase [Conexivisphaerales archaeon]